MERELIQLYIKYGLDPIHYKEMTNDLFRLFNVSGSVFPKIICDKCGGKIRRTHIMACPTNGLTYCEKCIDPEGKIYNDDFFGKTER